jgi:class 3 adenylate cyclase
MSEDKQNLFEEEENILKISNKICSDPDYLENPLLEHFKKITGSYNLLLKQSKKIVKISDFQQKMINETSEKLEEEKRRALRAQMEAEEERRKAEKLLLNILPKDVADELKLKGVAEPVLYESVSVMFTDFKGFTKVSEILSPKALVEELDKCFTYFDSLMDRHRLEKLKTIGDSYMCAGGIPRKNSTHAIDCILAAMEIQSFMEMMKQIKESQGLPYWELRLGIHTGSLVTGVIGEKKFAYDVWGDTVNTASRMESSGTPGLINISDTTYEIVKDYFDCEYRGKIKVKNKADIDMYFVKKIKEEFSMNGEGKIPNKSLNNVLHFGN